MNKQIENINKKITEKLTSEEHEHNLLKAKQEELIAKTEYRRQVHYKVAQCVCVFQTKKKNY